MLTTKKMAMIIALGILLASCNRGVTPFTPAELAAIAGEDADKNGVRDDIDALILKTYSEKDHREAFLQFARIEQSKLAADVTEESASKIMFETFRASDCVRKKIPAYSHPERIGREFWHGPLPYDPNRFFGEIIVLTANTDLRKRAMNRFSAHVTSFPVPDGSEEVCDF